MAVVGPGVIVLGASIGSGEFLLGPAVFVRHGLSLLWITAVAVFLQTIFNTELMRYTVATGEPVFSGFMRTWPSSRHGHASTPPFIFAGRLAGVGRQRRRRHLFHLGAVWRTRRCKGGVLHRRWNLSPLRRHSAGWPAHRANWSCLIGYSSCVSSAASSSRRDVRTSDNVAPGALGFAGFDTASQTFVFLPQARISFCLQPLVAFSGQGGAGDVR
jgi:hypothetical protein